MQTPRSKMIQNELMAQRSFSAVNKFRFNKNCLKWSQKHPLPYPPGTTFAKSRVFTLFVANNSRFKVVVLGLVFFF